METRDELSTTCNQNNSYVNVPVSRCYIPISLPLEQPSILYYLKALDTKRPVAGLAKGDLFGKCHLLSIQYV